LKIKRAQRITKIEATVNAKTSDSRTAKSGIVFKFERA